MRMGYIVKSDAATCTYYLLYFVAVFLVVAVVILCALRIVECCGQIYMYMRASECIHYTNMQHFNHK